jgi:hypothetical protein
MQKTSRKANGKGRKEREKEQGSVTRDRRHRAAFFASST